MVNQLMSNTLKKCMACMAFGSLVFLSGSVAQVRKRSICGRVVLKQSEAVAQTQVILDYEGIELNPGVIADGDGTFCVDNFVTDVSQRTTARLYVMSFCRPGDVMLTAPPFWPVLRKKERFAGKDIAVDKGNLTRVGDIDVQLIYGHVSLKILDRRHQPLLTQLSDWSPVWIRVRDQNGVRVHESGLSPTQIERSVDLRASQIALAVPTGTWTLEVALDGVPPKTDTARRAVKWLSVPSVVSQKYLYNRARRLYAASHYVGYL
jgi:hypothetical protein